MTDGVLSSHSTNDTVHLSSKYTLGPGVAAKATLGTATFQSDDNDEDGNFDQTGTYFVVGMTVSF